MLTDGQEEPREQRQQQGYDTRRGVVGGARATLAEPSAIPQPAGVGVAPLPSPALPRRAAFPMVERPWLSPLARPAGPFEGPLVNAGDAAEDPQEEERPRLAGFLAPVGTGPGRRQPLHRGAGGS